MDAATKGAMDAMSLVLGIIASLIAFISALAAVNGVLAFMGEQVGNLCLAQLDSTFTILVYRRVHRKERMDRTTHHGQGFYSSQLYHRGALE